ncbi:MAG: DUF3445 domain-containing protein [Pseudomonadota bacterium]
MSRPQSSNNGAIAAPFRIGLEAIAPDAWIEIDDRHAAQIAEKERLLATKGDAVFRAMPESAAAQREACEMLCDHLVSVHPEHVVPDGDGVRAVAGKQRVSAGKGVEQDLMQVSRLVQDDLVIMEKSQGVHRLTAASLCFPSSWRLEEKFGRAMADIHAPVPGFGPGTRTAAMIERIFDNLRDDLPARRYNWSLYASPDLYHPVADHHLDADALRSTDPSAWLRVERQTLRRLPRSGGILFTIKICVDPIAVLREDAASRAQAHALADHVDALTSEQADYKGMTKSRHEIARWLRDAADSAG